MVSERMMVAMESGSWIRKMFEEGARMKAQLGAENVFDFSLGNPDLPPPKELLERLSSSADTAGIHGYMPNSGFVDVREKIAAYLKGIHGFEFSSGDILMTVGASGAINVALKTLLSSNDEVIVITPYFMEYNFYISNFDGVMVPVKCKDDFSLDIDSIAKAITDRTKAIILNCPNNPSGKIYTDEEYANLSKVIGDKDICVISDEPYNTLVFDETPVPSVFKHFKRCFLANSFSKSLSLAGERIGYLAVSPNMPNREQFCAAMVFANRTLGFVNAPSIFQKVAADFIGVSNNRDEYRERSLFLHKELTEIGYECADPKATFYLFPKTPCDDDDRFSSLALNHGIIVVPGAGFGYKGHFRLSLCMPLENIKRSIPHFKALYEECKAERSSI